MALYIIKRYSNRKLYDPHTSRYVTLEDLKRLIRAGTDLRVEDAETDEDLTSLTLTQILLDSERTHQASVPATLLHQFIRHGEAWYGLLDRTLTANPLEELSDTTSRAAERFWSEWATAAGWRPPEKEASEAPAETASTPDVSLDDELAALREKLSSLEERVARGRRAVPKDRPARPRSRKGR